MSKNTSRFRMAARSAAMLVCLGLTGCGGGGDKHSSTSAQYAVGGTVAGLSGAGLILQNNGGSDLPVSASGHFEFSTPSPGGTSYSVVVKTQPSNPSQSCSVPNGVGTIQAAAVTSIAVTCTTNTYSLGGTVLGLTGTGLTIAVNGSQSLPITVPGSFTFPGYLLSGSQYSVTIERQPTEPAQVCTVSGDTGTIGASAVHSIGIQCQADSIVLLAGQLGGTGNIDGSGAAARFNYPIGLALDLNGNLLIADRENQLIRKINPRGMVSTLAGTPGTYGAADGPGRAATFYDPTGVAVDGAGNIYVADGLNNTIRKIDGSGVVSTLAGTAGPAGYQDGQGTSARFNDPMGVATDAAGNVYVADGANCLIRRVSPTGLVSTYAGLAGFHAGTDGVGSDARFVFPDGIASDGDALYVADSESQSVRKIAPGAIVTTLAGNSGISGFTDGTAGAAEFNNPAGVTVAGADILVADFSNDTIRKVTQAGVVTTIAGMAQVKGSADGTSGSARFNAAGGVVADRSGNIYVADTYNNTIRKIDATGQVSTFAGSVPAIGALDGQGIAARFNGPNAVTATEDGTVYVADTNNYTIRSITPAGVVATLAGRSGIGGGSDGTGDEARFGRVYGLAAGPDGNLYLADWDFDTIRRVTRDGVVTTIAGSGLMGAADGRASAASFSGPIGIAVDAQGNVYVGDVGNHSIRKISPTGSVSTLAGTSGLQGATDGTGAAARFSAPAGLALDPSGNLYVADTLTDTIRRVTPDGVVTTIAGRAFYLGSTDGTGTAALFNQPAGVALDPSGNIYVSEMGNRTIRKITPAGVVTTLVGSASSRGVQLGPIPGSLGGPQGIAFLPGPTHRLVEVDTENAVLTIDIP
jgi:sugar lactone lactonase YvrE